MKLLKNEPLFQTFRELCNQHGLAATVQRYVVYQTLASVKTHPTADMIYEMLHPNHLKVSRMSVYRILDHFTKCQLIRRVNHPGSAARYDACLEPHHHIICVECGRVFDAPRRPEETYSLPQEYIPNGFKVLGFTLDFQGICAECAANHTRK